MSFIDAEPLLATCKLLRPHDRPWKADLSIGPLGKALKMLQAVYRTLRGLKSKPRKVRRTYSLQEVTSIPWRMNLTRLTKGSYDQRLSRLQQVLIENYALAHISPYYFIEIYVDFTEMQSLSCMPQMYLLQSWSLCMPPLCHQVCFNKWFKNHHAGSGGLSHAEQIRERQKNTRPFASTPWE